LGNPGNPRSVALQPVAIADARLGDLLDPGLGAIRYRGLAKVHGQVLLAASAFNVRRWTRLESD
jgi:IS5 family transposase